MRDLWTDGLERFNQPFFVDERVSIGMSNTLYAFFRREFKAALNLRETLKAALPPLEEAESIVWHSVGRSRTNNAQEALEKFNFKLQCKLGQLMCKMDEAFVKNSETGDHAILLLEAKIKAIKNLIKNLSKSDSAKGN